MASYGTTQKCTACDKTVYPMELMSADGVLYHNTCFKCCHCNGRLALSNYSALEGKLYCKPHFEQLFKDSGILPPRKSQSSGKQCDQSKASAFFSGTQEKCAVCKKTVYPLEKITVEGEFYHKSCFKCAHGGCNLTTSNYAALDGNLYCKPHFAQLFKEKGSYTHLTQTTNSRRNSNASESEIEVEVEAKAETDESEQKPEEEAPHDE